MNNIKSFEQFNEMNYATYMNAADKVQRKGKLKAAHNLRDFAETNRKEDNEIVDTLGKERRIMKIEQIEDGSKGGVKRYAVSCHNSTLDFTFVNELNKTLALIDGDRKVFKLDSRKGVNKLKKIFTMFGFPEAFEVESVNDIYAE